MAYFIFLCFFLDSAVIGLNFFCFFRCSLLVPFYEYNSDFLISLSIVYLRRLQSNLDLCRVLSGGERSLASSRQQSARPQRRYHVFVSILQATSINLTNIVNSSECISNFYAEDRKCKIHCAIYFSAQCDSNKRRMLKTFVRHRMVENGIKLYIRDKVSSFINSSTLLNILYLR